MRSISEPSGASQHTYRKMSCILCVLICVLICAPNILNLFGFGGNFVLSEFKAVVLASLRSLVSTEWDSDHEAPWTSR